MKNNSANCSTVSNQLRLKQASSLSSAFFCSCFVFLNNKWQTFQRAFITTPTGNRVGWLELTNQTAARRFSRRINSSPHRGSSPPSIFFLFPKYSYSVFDVKSNHQSLTFFLTPPPPTSQTAHVRCRSVKDF